MNKKINSFKKIALILVVVILISFSFPLNTSYGLFTSILTKPVCWLFIHAIDGINLFLSAVSMPPTTNWQNFTKSLEENNFLDAWFDVLMSPDKIFSNKVVLLDANIFDAPDSNQNIIEIMQDGDQSLAVALKRTVSNIYVWLRNICAVVLLCLLIYTGIRILITAASPYEQAKWKKALLDWLKALCLLMFMHFIMVGIFYISDLLVDAMSISFNGSSITASIRWAFANTSWTDGTALIVITILYAYVTFLTIVFFISYFKRLVWVVILTVISPVVATSYALGNSQTQIFNKWIKEYILTVLLQAFHMLIFYILVGLPLGALGSNTSASTGWELLKNQFDITNQSSVMVFVYALIAMSLIRPAEKFFMRLFGFTSSEVAKQGSSESGVKTIKAVEKVVMQVAQVAAAVATGGAAAAGMAGGAMTSVAGKGASSMGQNALSELKEGENALNQLGEGEELNNDLSEVDIKGEREAYDALTEEGLNPESGWTADDYRAHMEMGKELEEKEKAFADKNKEASDATALKEAANQLKEAANQLKEGKGNKESLDGTINKIEQIDMSDQEFDQALGDKDPNAPGNKLLDRLKKGAEISKQALTNPDSLEALNEARAGLFELRNSMALDDDSKDENWRQGYLGYDSAKGKIDSTKKEKLDAFVSNKNNINYMQQTHGLSKEEAKARLQQAAPYINMGMTNVQKIDQMLGTQERTGKTPAQAVMANLKSEKVINNQSNVNAVAQLIAKSSGGNASSPQIQEKAKQVMQQSRPYVEAGQKNPEVLHRLVQLEQSLKNGKMAPGLRTPDKVMRVDKYIDKAIKSGVKQIDLTSGKSVSAGVKQLENVMNKELRDRTSN